MYPDERRSIPVVICLEAHTQMIGMKSCDSSDGNTVVLGEIQKGRSEAGRGGKVYDDAWISIVS
jgi:hypothetical protein